MKISIHQDRVTELKEWFTKYVHTFQNDDPEIQQNIDLKEQHTMRVCRAILAIGKQLGLNDDELRLAEIIALFHDIGRFEQFARYKTFKDSISENHAELGLKELDKFDVLESFDNKIKQIIVRAIKYHNRAAIPLDETNTCLFYAKLIRDADKVDILKVVTDYYREPDGNEAIGLNLPDTDGFSDEIYQGLINKQIVEWKCVKNLNDFKLLQIGWVFDINYKPTLDCILEHNYLEKIRDVLPESEKIDEIFRVIQMLKPQSLS